MKLFNLDHSPYATRVRIQASYKGVELALEPPPVALRTVEFGERFPMAKIPVLQLDTGEEIGDSWAIMEYLEDVVPQPGLRPVEAVPHAHMNQIMRCSDTAFGPAGLFPLFRRVGMPDGIQGAAQDLEAMAVEMARLERLLLSLPDCRKRPLHLGDIALAPSIAYWLALAPRFDVAAPLAEFAAVATWWEWVNGHGAVADGLEEMLAAAAAFLGA